MKITTRLILERWSHKRRGPLLVLLALALGLSASLVAGQAFSKPAMTTINVTTTNSTTGGPDCTLRDAITAANTAAVAGGCDGTGGAPYLVVLVAGPEYLLKSVDNSDPDGPNGLPIIDTDITIDGQSKEIRRDDHSVSSPLFRIFNVSTGATLTIKDVTVASGGGQGIDGGGILNNGTVILDNVVLRYNKGIEGGGIMNNGYLTIDNSIVTYNMAGCGGAIQDQGYLTVTNSTFSANTAYT